MNETIMMLAHYLLFLLLCAGGLVLAHIPIKLMKYDRNERYLHFGRTAAKLDDAANYLPARLAALLLIAAAALTGENPKDALRIWRRDRRKHASPNSAQCEAAMAGALGLRLCGPAVYFGTQYDKPYIGDDNRPIEPEDIPRACRMEYAGAFLGLAVMGLIRLAWIVTLGG